MCSPSADNFFDDQRPRLLLFPTETVAENFYRELATMPNRYRDWLQKQPDIPPWPELDPSDEEMTTDSMIDLEDQRQAYVKPGAPAGHQRSDHNRAQKTCNVAHECGSFGRHGSAWPVAHLLLRTRW